MQGRMSEAHLGHTLIFQVNEGRRVGSTRNDHLVGVVAASVHTLYTNHSGSVRAQYGFSK